MRLRGRAVLCGALWAVASGAVALAMAGGGTVLAGTHGTTLTGAAGAPGAGKGGGAGKAPGVTRAATVQVASATLDHDRMVRLTATKASGGSAPAATVRLAIYHYASGQWRLQDQITVGREWFWYPLTGPGAVCRLSVSDRAPERMAVSLLVTPSIGCSPTYHYHVRDGQIVPGDR